MEVIIRNATNTDLFVVYKILSDVSLDDDGLLHRSIYDIKQYLNTFKVAEFGGVVVGCVATHPYSKSLCEIRSHAIDTRYRSRGLGTALIKAAIEEAQKTYKVIWVDAKKENYFISRWDFCVISRTNMPLNVLFLKLKWVFSQARNRWLPSLTGRFKLLELRVNSNLKNELS